MSYWIWFNLSLAAVFFAGLSVFRFGWCSGTLTWAR